MITAGNIVSYKRISNSNHDSLLHRRMMHLKSMGFAEWDTANGNFIIKEGWQDTLSTVYSFNNSLFFYCGRFWGLPPLRGVEHNVVCFRWETSPLLQMKRE
jgi:hypothetical protein